MLSALLTLRKLWKLRHALSAVLSLITLILAFFLLVGSTRSSTSYSSIHLMTISFNDSSPIIQNVEASNSSESGNSSYIGAQIYTGFLGSCIKTAGDEDDIICGYTDNLFSQLDSQLPRFSLYNELTNSTTYSLDIAKISSSFQKSLSRAGLYLLVVVLACEALELVVGLAAVAIDRWYTKWASAAHLCLAGISGVSFMFTTFMICWVNGITKSAKVMIEQGSLGLLVASAGGGRAGRIEWVIMVMALLVTFLELFKVRKRATDTDSINSCSKESSGSDREYV